jgi:hypothetical protein
VRDVANVRDGSSPQTNMVHVEGKRSVLMSILKAGNASTLDVTSRIHAMLPSTLEKLPKELKVSLLFDQSLFVRAAVQVVGPIGKEDETLGVAQKIAARMEKIPGANPAGRGPPRSSGRLKPVRPPSGTSRNWIFSGVVKDLRFLPSAPKRPLSRPAPPGPSRVP